MNFTEDQILGCIIGGAIGDALGGPYEGQAGQVTVDDSRPWVLSDDTQLTLATCEAITDPAVVSPEAVANRFAEWYKAGRVTGMGASTLKALSELAAGAHWALAGRTGEMAAGNGAAMRIAPLAFCLDPEVETDRHLIRYISRITHKNEEACIGALAMVMAIRAAAAAGSSRTASDLALLARQLPDSRVRDRLIELSAYDPHTGPSELANRFGCSGYVAESVPLAIFCAQRVEHVPFKHLLTGVVSAGGDTDTIASMTGQIAGTRLGLSSLPQVWIARVPEIEWVLSIARAFAKQVWA